MLVFHCPSCNAKMQAKEEYAGQTVACPACELPTQVPSSGSTDAISAAPTQARVSPAPEAITTPEQTRAARQAPDRADDRPGRRERVDNTGAVVGMSVGMIVLIVVGIVGCVGVGGVALLIALLVPAVQKVREAAARTQTMNNMKQIVIAQHGYHDSMKTLPLPRMKSMQPDGQRKTVDLSWRVAILPHIEQENLFRQFDTNSPWDSPRNAPFARNAIMVYGNPTRPDPDPTQTRFQYFTGPQTLFPDGRDRVPMATVQDGHSNVFLFAEANTPVPWPKGADMVVTPNGALPSPPDRFLAAMVDGSVRAIDRRRASDDVLRLVIDPSDARPLPADWDR